MTDPTQEPSMWQNAIIALSGAVGAAAGWFGGRHRRPAAESAEIAEYRADESKSRAESGLYDQLLSRVTSLEEGHRKLQHELDAERRVRRAMEDHVGLLERLMRAAGLNPPKFERPET